MLVSGVLVALTLAAGPVPRYVASLATPTPAPTATSQPDADLDGVPDPSDPCPSLAHPAPSDLDGDNWGDACDLDLDGDGASNYNDACPFDAGEACLGPDPVTVNLLNPAVLSDQATARVSYLGLTTFENPDPERPALLNGAVYPASDSPLWSASGDLTLNLTFQVETEPPLFATAGGPLGLAGGRIALTCPASGMDGIDGLCIGRLSLDLLADGAPVAAPPDCSPGDARCAWSVNAAFAGPEMTNVWGAYDPGENILRFATGLPAFAGNTFATLYSVEMRLSDGGQVAYAGVLPGVELPYELADGENDCRDVEDQPADCLPSSDIRSVSLSPELTDGAPFLVIKITTGGEIPQDRQAEYTVFDLFTVVGEDGQFLVHSFDAFPAEGGWQIRGFVRLAEGQSEPLEALPDGMSLVVEGNTAEFRLPVSPGPQRTVIFNYVRTRTHSGQEALHVDRMRDAAFDSPPLVFFVHGSGEPEGASPLIGFPLFQFEAAEYHTYAMMPFPGSPLAEALAPVPGN